MGAAFEAMLGLEYASRVEDRDGRLSVAHIAPLDGGAAIAANRLHLALRRAGVASNIYVTPSPTPELNLDNVYGLPRPNRLLQFADRSSERITWRFGLLGMLNVSSLFWSFPGFDVVHLHGADSGWFNLHALHRLNRRHALVWTMHDKQLGTGGSGYPDRYNCERWLNGCGQCPKVKAQGWWFDFSHFIQARKRSIVSSTQMAIVAPSQWMFDFISRSPVTKGQTLSLIPNGVDTKIFQPLPPERCRAELELPPNHKYLLAVASNLGDPRKGWQYFERLIANLRAINAGDIALVLIGETPPDDELKKLRAILPVYARGKINSVDLLAKAYNAADIFVIPSVIDNLPSVVLESLACGTPVAGFRVGGIPDMVVPGETGVLAELGDTAALAVQMKHLLDYDCTLAEMRISCRSIAVHDFSCEIQAARHRDLYQRMIAEVRSRDASRKALH